MADIPPITDATTERNHSRDGGEDQQQSAVRPPSPSDSILKQNAAGNFGHSDGNENISGLRMRAN